MNHPDRLIRRIGAVLNGETEGFEARALASDYAALMETTRERLHQCAALIRTHNEHTALQIAESDPPVLDLAAKLAFSDSSKWRAWCKSAGLPAPAPLEDHLIELVNSLYSKAIDQTHPLYKEYRAAVREHDDLRALTVLRSITRVNVNDANAREEYDRLTAKVRRELLSRMRECFAHRRDEEAFGYMTKLETSGLGPFDDNADWRDAAKARNDWESRKMLGEALMTIPDLLRLKAAGEWEACIPLLAKARMLRQQYRFHLGAEDEKQFAHLESWVMGHSAVAEKVRVERELIDELIAGVETLKSRFAEPPQSAAEASARITEIDAWLESAAASPETVHIEAAVTYARTLRTETENARRRFGRRRRITVTAAAAGTLALGAAAGLFITETLRTRAFADALAVAESAQRIRPVEAFLGGPVKDSPGYAAAYAERVASLRDRAQKAARTLSDIVHGSKEIADTLARPGAAAASQAEKLAALEQRFATLPEDTRVEARAALDSARDALETVRDAATARALVAVRDAAEALDTLLLTPERKESLEGWQAAAAALTTALAAADTPDKPAVTAAKETLARARAVFPVAAIRTGLDRDIGAARTLDAHLAAIAAAASATINAPEVLAARRVNDAARDLRRLPAPLLPAATAALTPYAVPGTRFISAETSALEASDASRLVAECAKHTDIWRLPIARNGADGTGGNIVAFFKGRPEIVTYSLNGGEETRTKGQRLKPDGTALAVSYSYRRFDGRPGVGDQPGVPAKANECEVYAAVLKLFDSDRGVFTESPLALADRIYAMRGASPLLRARMLLLLHAIVDPRAEARGPAFSPELREELAALKKICGESPPAETAWLSPERYGDILPALTRHFETKRPSYAALADFRVRLLRACLDSGCAYAGACDASGAPVLLKPVPAKGVRMIALDEQGKPAVIGLIGDAGALVITRAAAPRSPVLVLAKPPAEIAESLSATFHPQPPEGDWTNLILPAP